MKTRNFIAKAMASIVNLERYPTLFSDLFAIFYTHSDDEINHNKIHGLFEILNSVIERNAQPFKHNFTADEFLQQLKPVLGGVKHVPVNYTSIMSLLSKIYFKSTNSLTQQTLIYEMSVLQTSALATLQSSLEQTEPCLALPGTHDFLASIGFNWCIIAESSSVARRAEFEAEIARLVDANSEYSMNLQRGVLSYLKRIDVVVSVELYASIVRVFKKRVFNSIENSRSINNNLDLKTVISFTVVDI
jgi:hypothetical protein